MGKPNIVLIVLDAVRAQNMSLYGYKRETTPFLKDISKECTVYKNAVSTSYWTLPSCASAFTSTYTSKHGLAMLGAVLDYKFKTMAEVLRKHGYKTIGICPNPFVSKLTGLHRGFEIFRDPARISFQSKMYRFVNGLGRLTYAKRTGEKLRENLLKRQLFMRSESGFFGRSNTFKKARWIFTGLFDKYARVTNNQAFGLVKKNKEKPFFLYIHYNEAHTPYVLPRSFRERFLTSIPEGKPWNMDQDFFKYYSEGVKTRRSDLWTIKALYDGAINYLDSRVFELYSFFQKRRLLDNTMLIITSDHGDGFGEHGIRFHCFCLYNILIKIPLIIKYPLDSGISRVENRVVQNVDILPTIMDLLGIYDQRLIDQIQGNSLLSSKIHKRDYSYAISELVKPFGPRMRTFKDKLKKYDRELISICTENRKYIYATNGNHEFYDLANDPGETRNLIDSSDPAVEELGEKLKPWLAAFYACCRKVRERIGEEKLEGEFETEIKQRLKNLGYL